MCTDDSIYGCNDDDDDKHDTCDDGEGADNAALALLAAFNTTIASSDALIAVSAAAEADMAALSATATTASASALAFAFDIDLSCDDTSDSDIFDDNNSAVDDPDEDVCLLRDTRCFLWLTLCILFTSSSYDRFDMLACCKSVHVSKYI